MKPPVRYILLRFKELTPVPRCAFSRFGRQRKLRGVTPVLHNGASCLPDFEITGPVLVAGVKPEQHGEPADSVFFCLLSGHV